MTYIEFFDIIASENVSACLTYTPDRVIYIGDNSKAMARHIENYKKVFEARGQEIEFLYRTVSKNNLDNAVKMIAQIVESYDDCVFDITGGEEIYNLALGIVYASNPDRNIQIHRFNLNNNAIYDCDKDGTTVYRDIPSLTVEENVRIYGGDVVYGDVFGDDTYKWDLNPGFLADIERIWGVCKGNVRLWNTVCGTLEAIENSGKISGLTTTVRRDALNSYLLRHSMKYVMTSGILDYLLTYGLLKEFDESNEEIKVSYKNEQVKRCLIKAGQALEMKVYVTAKSIADSDDKLIYNDALNGVVIDWDGELHDESKENIYDTENEVDILLMHNVVPIFISCKNGIVTAEELYKLNTVAERFGGKYAKKVLVSTAISSLGEAGKYLRQRADDMDIYILEDVQDLSEKEFKRKIKNLWCT